MENNNNNNRFPIYIEHHWLLVLAGILTILSGHPLGIIVGVGLFIIAWSYVRKQNPPKNP